MVKRNKQALVIFNPRSGPLTDKALWLGLIVEKLCIERKYYATIKCTEKDMDIDRIFETVDKPLDLIVAAGGDGTIRAVLGAASERFPHVPVSLVPVGTGNQLARNLGIFEESFFVDPVHTVLDAMVRGSKRSIDLGKVNGQYFCVGVGVGPLSDAVSAPSQEDKESWGMLAYVGSMLQTLSAVPAEVRVTADGDSFSVKAGGVFVTNVGQFGVTTISDTASLDDGMLDLCIITLSEFSDYVKMGFQLATAILGGAPYYLRKVKKLKIESLAAPLSVNVDGDVVGTTPIEIEVLPRAVTVLTGR